MINVVTKLRLHVNHKKKLEKKNLNFKSVRIGRIWGKK